MFLVLAAFPVDECPTISNEEDNEEVMYFYNLQTNIIMYD